jgi:hypothetical protein
MVDAMIAYWKSVAEWNFKKTDPNSDSTEFDRVWPKVLNNFFLAETVRTTKLLRAFSPRGRDD